MILLIMDMICNQWLSECLHIDIVNQPIRVRKYCQIGTFLSILCFFYVLWYPTWMNYAISIIIEDLYFCNLPGTVFKNLTAFDVPNLRNQFWWLVGAGLNIEERKWTMFSASACRRPCTRSFSYSTWESGSGSTMYSNFRSWQCAACSRLF